MKETASETAFFKVLTDDELFLACGGRTAHKYGMKPLYLFFVANLFVSRGARHGLKQSGKLSRLEKQEKMLLKKLKNVSLSDDEYVLKKKVKKLSKHKEMCQTKTENDDELDSLSSCSSNTSHKKQKRKKKNRRVSFNELVTEYHNPKPENSPKEIGEDANVPVIVEARIRDDNDNEVNNQGEQDEGIEQDFEENEDHVGRFEEPQGCALDKLSKKERKLLKKKRKFERKAGATVKFLEEMDLKQDWEGGSDYQLGKCKKRKLKNDLLKLDEVVSKKLHSEYENLERFRNDFAQFEGDIEAAQKRKEMSWKRRKMAERKQTKQINSIVESMNQVCKISDAEQ